MKGRVATHIVNIGRLFAKDGGTTLPLKAAVSFPRPTNFDNVRDMGITHDIDCFCPALLIRGMAFRQP